jgi:hypothetical protein
MDDPFLATQSSHLIGVYEHSEPESRLNNNSFRTAKKTQNSTVKMINWLTLFKEIIPVYTGSHKTDKYKMKLLTVEDGGTYNYHWGQTILLMLAGKLE